MTWKLILLHEIEIGELWKALEYDDEDILKNKIIMFKQLIAYG